MLKIFCLGAVAREALRANTSRKEEQGKCQRVGTSDGDSTQKREDRSRAVIMRVVVMPAHAQSGK